MSDNPYSGSAVKKSAVHFLIGKVFSALITISILLSLVRVLTIPEYGAYITLVAALDLANIVSGLGISWVEARYIPDYRLHASKSVLLGFIAKLLQLKLFILFFFTVVIWLSLDWLLKEMNMSAYSEAAHIYVWMLLVEGFARRLRDDTLGALLQQKFSQISLVLRNFIFVSLLGALFFLNDVNLLSVVQAELFASFIGVLIALVGLLRSLKQVETKEDPSWTEPSWSQMWQVARNMYFSLLVGMAYGMPVFVLLIRRTFGEQADAATALFGFLSNIYSQTGAYLPAILLFSLIRPKLVASYVGEGGIFQLARNANLVGKFSLFVLMSLIVFVALSGDELILLLSGGKFSNAGYYFLGLLFALIPLSQRQILETVSVVTGNSDLCNYASLWGIITLPITYALIKLDFGLWGPIISLNVGSILFSGIVIKGMTKRTDYNADMAGFYRMLLSALLAYLVSFLLIIQGHGWTWLIVIGLLAFVTFLISSAIIKPFSEDERSLINQQLKRNLFIW